MRAVIIDDNEKARIALKSDLEDYCEHVDVVGEADGVESGLKVLAKKKPDLVFLDIKMGDRTGFDLLEELPKENACQVIFTTAYDEFAIKAFKYSALDYLLKPIDSDDLVKAVDKVKVDKGGNDYSDLIDQLKGKKPQNIVLAESDRIHVVAIESIIRCSSDKNYTTFWTTDHKQITVSKTLKEYDELLSDQDFVRVHHGHLVNINQIKELVKVGGPYLVMKDDSQVPVSSRKKDDLMQKLKETF